MKKILMLIIVTVFIYGCATTPNMDSNPVAATSDIQVESNDGKVVQIDKASKICVFVPKDGYNPDRYWEPVAGSGLVLANAVTQAFSEYFPNTKEVLDDKDLNKAIKEAREQNYDYIVYPKILVWTNHNTFLSGIPNEAKINIRVYSLKQRRVDNSFMISENGKQFESYGITTVDLVQEPLKQIAKLMVLN